MRNPLRNIEDFVREKLSFLDNSYPDDWAAFERKLQRAIFFRRLKVFTSFAVLTAVLFLTHQGLINPAAHSTEGTITRNPVSIESAPSLQVQEDGVAQPPKNDQIVSLNPTKVSARKLANSKNQKIAANNAAAKPAVINSKEETRKEEPVDVAMRGVNVQLLEAPTTLSIKKTHFAQAPIRRKILLDDGFFDVRSPNFKVKSPERSGPYISPLQPENEWSYAVNVYPNFTFRKFKVDPDKESMLHSDFIHEMQDNEKTGFSLNIGLEVSKRIGPVTYLNSGIEYITNTYEADFNFTNFRDADIDPVSGEITGYHLKTESEQIAFADNNQFHYLNIPLTISYQPWANEHLRLNIEAGASYLRFMKARGTTIDYKTLEVIDLTTQNYRQEMASFSLKFGAQYYVTPTINIGFEPTLMYFTNTIYTEEYPFYVIPYSVGLNFNVQVKLN